MGTFNNPFNAPTLVDPPVNGLGGNRTTSIFSMVNSTTVANTLTETTLINTTGAVGTTMIPANYLQVGTIAIIRITGSIATNLTPLITLKLYHGATVLSTASFTVAAAVAASTFFEYTATISTSTTGVGANVVSGQVMWINSLASGNVAVAPTVATDNTTISGALDVKITWGTANAGNAITSTTCYIEVIG